MAEIVSGLQFIPNQPIVFNQDTDCDTCEPTEFCSLHQSDEYIEIQIKQNPCDTNLICDTPFAEGDELLTDTLMALYGDDLVQNGDFATGAFWGATPPEATISGGAAHFIPGTNVFAYVAQTISSAEHGQWHRIQYLLSNVIAAGDNINASLYDGAVTFGPESTNGVKTAKARGGSTDDELTLFVTQLGGVTFTCDLDNVSLRRICPEYLVTTANWTPLEPGFRHTAGATDSLEVDITATATTYYVVRVTILNSTAGGITASLAGGTASGATSGNGTFTIYITSGATLSTGLLLTPTSNFDGDIMLVSLKEVTTCFNVDDTWVITEDGLMCSGGDSSTLIQTGSPILALNYYQCEIEIYNYGSGTLQFEIGTEAGDLLSGNGAHKDFITAATNGQIKIIPSTDFVGCFKISSLSVIRLTNALEVTLIDADGNEEAELDGKVTFYDDVINIKFKPSETLNLVGQPISMGCKTICVKNPCSEEIDYFESTFGDGSGWTDGGSGFMTTGGGNMVYDCPNPPNTGGTGSSSHAVVVTGGYQYRCILTVDALSGSPCSLQVVMVDGNAIQAPVLATGDVELIVSPASNGVLIQINISKLGAPSSVLSLSRIVVTEIRPIDREYCSSCFKIVEDAGCAKLIEAYSDTNGMGFNFESGFKLRSRVLSKFIASSYSENSNEYTDTGGDGIKNFASTQKKQTLFIEGVPEYMHDFIRVAKNCPTFIIDDTEYIAENNEYKPEWQGMGFVKKAPARFDVYKKDKGTLFNFACE